MWAGSWRAAKAFTCALGFAVVTNLIASSLAVADIPNYRIDFGTVPGSGDQAATTLDTRTSIAIENGACGREFEFWNAVEKPGEDLPKKYQGDPYPELIAKVAFLATRPNTSCESRVPYGTRDPSDAANPWSEPFSQQRWSDSLDATTKSSILSQVNAVFTTRFGSACDKVVTDLIPAPSADQQALIEFKLSPECMRTQVNVALMTRDRFGTNPGSSGLPCHVVGKPTPGDWDMAVFQLTRLVFLARNVRALFDSQTLTKLNQLLTLSGPLQGESYGLYQCGNPDNTTGSAEERAAEADFYDDGFFDDVGSLMEWLLAFLLITLIFIAAAVLIAVAAGPALGPGGLLAAALAGAAAGAWAATAITVIRIPETENHLMMINTSKYLKNQLIIEELTDQDDQETFREYNRDIREWLLDRLQRIVKEDFVEYNARPYQRLSIGAILNIADFANDPDKNPSVADTVLRTSAAAVLDLAATKMALASSQGRRIAPFRRLAGTNANFTYGSDLANPKPQHLFDLGGGADHMIAAMLLWSGQTQHTENHRASVGAGGEMMFEATSTYRPHALILDIAIDKSRPYEQRIHHGGWEHYSSGAGWLLTAGGTSTTFAQQALIAPFSIPFVPPLATDLKFLKNENRGAGVPTTLMPLSATMRQDQYPDFLRFEGIVKVWDKADPEDSQPVPCLQRPAGTPRNLSFIDSGACQPYAEAPRFFVVVYRQRCALGWELCKGGWWGFIEVVDAEPQQSLAEFAQATIQRNGNRFATMRAAAHGDGIDPVSYVSWKSGTILFDPDEPDDDDEATGIIQVSGGPDPHADLDNWGRAEGDILTYTGDERVSIGRPLDPRRIDIDLTDAEDPKRVLPP
jgi:hypothetical protein